MAYNLEIFGQFPSFDCKWSKAAFQWKILATVYLLLTKLSLPIAVRLSKLLFFYNIHVHNGYK